MVKGAKGFFPGSFQFREGGSWKFLLRTGSFRRNFQLRVSISKKSPQNPFQKEIFVYLLNENMFYKHKYYVITGKY
jgi:hypothetical protein